MFNHHAPTVLHRELSDSDQPLLKAQEVCSLLRISLMTLHRMQRSGRIVPVRPNGRAVRFRLEDVKAIANPESRL